MGATGRAALQENLEKKRRTLMKQVKTSLPLDADEQAERIEREVRGAGNRRVCFKIKIPSRVLTRLGVFVC